MNGRPESTSRGEIDISVVCAPAQHAGDLAAIHEEFRNILAGTGRTVEFLYVLNGPHPAAEDRLSRIVEETFPVRILRMAKGFDEAAALQYALDQSRGRLVLTIPDRFQIAPATVSAVLARLDAGAEVVVTKRDPRKDALVNRLQSRVFHWLARKVYRQGFRDMTCDLRGFTRRSARDLDLYGDLHRFIPILAARKGYDVVEIPGAQRQEDLAARVFRPGVYARRLLDILQLFFLTRFTRKPLRFFGLIGMGLGTVGFVVCAWLAASKILGRTALADRPLLLLGVLLIVLGVQLTSIGLIGEIIIFFSTGRDAPEVEQVDPEER